MPFSGPDSHGKALLPLDSRHGRSRLALASSLAGTTWEAALKHLPRDIVEVLLERISDWPNEALNELFRAMGEVELKYDLTYKLTDEDREAIERGLAAADAGRFASDGEVEALFNRYFK